MGDIGDYYRTNKLQMPDIEAYISIKNRLNNVIGEKYPGAKLVMFGSTLSGLGGSDCDADLCLWFPGQCAEAGNQGDIASGYAKLKRIYDHLKGMGPTSPVVDRELSPPDTRVPIIKCIHKRHRTSVDINVNVTDGVVATYLQVKYINCKPLIAALVFTVKQWAKKRGICDPSNGTLKSYGWVLLVINYLQVKGVVPVYKPSGQGWAGFRLADVNISDLESRMITMIRGGFDDPNFLFEPCGHHASGGSITIHDLLTDFFKRYQGFDFKRGQIDVRSGAAPVGPIHASSMYIQDPILGQNVAEKVDDSGLKKIRSECRRAYDIITSDRSWTGILS